jgi:hypothetical protein
MIKSVQKLFLTVLFLFFGLRAFCQTGTMPGASDSPAKPDDKTKDETSSFKFGVNYLSNNVFMGRSDTAVTPIIIPEAKYTFKNGIYFSGALDYIPSKKMQKLDGGEIAGGYDFDITDDFSGGASFTKLFYSATSTQIASSVTSTFNVNFNYDIGSIISVSLSSDYNLNKGNVNNDFFITPGLSHDFIAEGIFGETDILLISPTVSVNAGTQNFYDAYLNKKKLKTAKLTKAQNALLTKYVNQLGQFGLLDYEISAPVEYKAGHFIFQFTPTYAIVQNELPKQIAVKLSDQPSIFYFEIGASLKF